MKTNHSTVSNHAQDWYQRYSTKSPRQFVPNPNHIMDRSNPKCNKREGNKVKEGRKESNVPSRHDEEARGRLGPRTGSPRACAW